MYTYLLTLGLWNFVGSIMMLGFVSDKFGHKMLVDWNKIFKEDYSLNGYGRMWCLWASGLNIFFGLINVMAWSWQFDPLGIFLIYFDLVSYLTFILLAIRLQMRGGAGSGIYSVYLIFSSWIGWGIYVLMNAI